MKTVKVTMIVVIVLLAVVAIGLCGFLVLSLTGVMPQLNLFSWTGNLELANRQVLSAEELSSLSVQYSSEKIKLLYSASAQEIVLEEYMSSWDEDMLATVNRQDGAVNISAGKRPLRPFWRAEIRLYLPAAWAGEVALSNSSGSIRGDEAGTFHFGSFSAKCSSGSIRLNHIESDGDITLQTSSGSVEAQALDAPNGRIDLSASSGSIRMGNTNGRQVAANTSSGSIRGKAVCGESVEASASSGSIQFEYLGGQFALKNTSGSITVEGGDGYGTAQTSSGSVRVALEALGGDLSLSSTSGSCRLTLPLGTAIDFSAETNSGSIKVDDAGGLGSVSYNQKGNQAQGSFGQGTAQNAVQMKASSGSVRLEWS